MPASDLTIVYLTANKLREPFAANLRAHLQEAAVGIPIISVSKKPLDFGENIVMDTPLSAYQLYRQAYEGMKHVKTRYVAIAEDDALYHMSHFELRPDAGVFAYDMSFWSLYTWVRPAQFTFKLRKNGCGLISERDLYMQDMEERFAKWPAEESTPEHVLAAWSEPGRKERVLGIKEYPMQELWARHPSVRFCHEDESLGWAAMGNRKRMGAFRAFDVPQWGTADDMLKRYTES